MTDRTTEPTGLLQVWEGGVDLILPRTIAAAPAELWSALTRPDRTAKWYHPWEWAAPEDIEIAPELAAEIFEDAEEDLFADDADSTDAVPIETDPDDTDSNDADPDDTDPDDTDINDTEPDEFDGPEDLDGDGVPDTGFIRLTPAVAPRIAGANQVEDAPDSAIDAMVIACEPEQYLLLLLGLDGTGYRVGVSMAATAESDATTDLVFTLTFEPADGEFDFTGLPQLAMEWEHNLDSLIAHLRGQVRPDISDYLGLHDFYRDLPEELR